MAEEKKSIEISYKANIKDLVSKLEQIPNVTKQEAKKMVAALDRQLKQAEKAAKQSATASKKAAQEMAKGAKRGARDFDQLADAAQHAGQRMEVVAEKSGDIDRGFSGVGLALRGVNPKLAETADGMADTFAVVESLIMGFGSLNPLLLVGATVVGGVALAYTSYTESIEEAKRKTEKIKEEIEKLNQKIKEQKDIIIAMDREFGGFTEAVNESGLELALLRGEISEFDAATMRATQTANKFRMEQQQTFDTQKTALETSVKARASEVKILNIQIAQMKEQRKITQSSSEKWGGASPKFKEMTFEEKQLRLNQQLLNDQLKTDRDRLSELDKQQNLVARQSKQLEKNLIAIEQIKAAEKARTDNQKDFVKSKKEELAIDPFLEESTQGELSAIQARNALQAQYNMALLDDTDQQIQKVEDRYNIEYEKLLKLGIISGEHQLAQDMAYELDKQRLAEIDEIQKDNHDKQLDRINEQVAKYSGMANVFVGSLDTFAGAVGEYLKNTDKLTEESANKLFRLEQTAAVAGIAMETAKAIAASLGLPPVVRGATIAAITAAGAAQTAAVLSQQPPTLHMGGMAPDETRATLLTGEAVLDRTTVRNMGGPEGVRQLQNGQQGTNNVVIIQPFKHIDRYNRSARRLAGRSHAGAY